MGKYLVVYYSYSGMTRGLAEAIAGITGGDLRALVPQQPYDFSRHGATRDARSEVARGYCPALLSGQEPVVGYDAVFIGSPNWFKSLAPPVLSFLRSADWDGKMVIPFCTHGGGGFGEIADRIAQECANARVLPGLAAAEGYDAGQVRAWIAALGLPGGEQE